MESDGALSLLYSALAGRVAVATHAPMQAKVRTAIKRLISSLRLESMLAALERADCQQYTAP
jgi:hypothetical protein